MNRLTDCTSLSYIRITLFTVFNGFTVRVSGLNCTKGTPAQTPGYTVYCIGLTWMSPHYVHQCNSLYVNQCIFWPEMSLIGDKKHTSRDLSWHTGHIYHVFSLQSAFNTVKWSNQPSLEQFACCCWSCVHHIYRPSMFCFLLLHWHIDETFWWYCNKDHQHIQKNKSMEDLIDFHSNKVGHN